MKTTLLSLWLPPGKCKQALQKQMTRIAHPYSNSRKAAHSLGAIPAKRKHSFKRKQNSQQLNIICVFDSDGLHAHLAQ